MDKWRNMDSKGLHIIKEDALMDLLRRINELIKVAGKEDLEIIQDSIDSFPAYINTIVKMETGIKIARFRCNSQEEFIEEVQRLDRNRHFSHNAAIVSVKILNRLCNSYGVEEIYQGDIEDRQEVATFAKKIVDIYYKIRK